MRWPSAFLCRIVVPSYWVMRAWWVRREQVRAAGKARARGPGPFPRSGSCPLFRSAHLRPQTPHGPRRCRWNLGGGSPRKAPGRRARALLIPASMALTWPRCRRQAQPVDVSVITIGTVTSRRDRRKTVAAPEAQPGTPASFLPPTWPPSHQQPVQVPVQRPVRVPVRGPVQAPMPVRRSAWAPV